MTVEQIIEQLRAQTDRPRRPPHHGSMLLVALEALQEIARDDRRDAQEVAQHALRLIVRQSRMR